jgi:uncharacterized membrane protein
VQSGKISGTPCASMADSSENSPEPRSAASHSRAQALGPSQSPDHSADPEVVSRVSEVLTPLLRDPTQARQVIARIVEVTESFSGPLPHPQHLKGYDDIVPGSAREILKLATLEQRHRHCMQKLEMIYPYFGWFAGFVGFLACILLAAYLAMAGHEGIAGGMLGVPSLGVIGWFVRSRITASSPSGFSERRVQPAAREPKRKRR